MNTGDRVISYYGLPGVIVGFHDEHHAWVIFDGDTIAVSCSLKHLYPALTDRELP